MRHWIQTTQSGLRRFINGEDAATTTEYALMLSVLAIVAITAAVSMGENLSQAVSHFSTDVSDASSLTGNGGLSGPTILAGPQSAASWTVNR